MTKPNEHYTEVDGRWFKILSHDYEMMRRNNHAGIPHIWHGVAEDGTSGRFATYTEIPKTGLATLNTIKID